MIVAHRPMSSFTGQGGAALSAVPMPVDDMSFGAPRKPVCGSLFES